VNDKNYFANRTCLKRCVYYLVGTDLDFFLQFCCAQMCTDCEFGIFNVMLFLLLWSNFTVCREWLPPYNTSAHCYNVAVAVPMVCRHPSRSTVFCHAVWIPKFIGLTSSVTTWSQVGLPCGHFQDDSGLMESTAH